MKEDRTTKKLKVWVKQQATSPAQSFGGCSLPQQDFRMEMQESTNRPKLRHRTAGHMHHQQRLLVD